MKFAAAIVMLFAFQQLELLDNFAPNPSFELDENRDLRPDGWSASTFASSGTAEWDHHVARTGQCSLRISNPGQPTTTDWKHHTVRWSTNRYPIAPGTEYTLEVWVKTQDVTGRARALLTWHKDDRWLSEVSTEKISGTRGWTKLSLSGQAPEQADSVRIVLELSAGMGTAWFDDVRVKGRSKLPPKVVYVFRDTKDWFPFEFPLDDTNRDSIDLTHLLDPPAGKHGFLTVGPDGHFYFEDGTPVRFFGVNIVGPNVACSKEIAEKTAARLAKFGVNMVRLHAFDSPSAGIIDYTRGDSRHFNAEALDRMDYFVAQLKKHGIYIYLDLLDYRRFKTADGVTEGDLFTHNWAGSMKGASIFDERMIELQKEYATNLLTHRNPYTGLRYVDDPAIAVVEITNENSLFYFLLMQDLSRPYYREKLRQLWNQWLLQRYGSQEALRQAWTDGDGTCELTEGEDLEQRTVQMPRALLGHYSRQPETNSRMQLWGPARVRDALQFLGALQENYYQQMQHHLKQVIGVRVPITGTNQVFQLRDTLINAKYSDFISRNQYWQHPNVRAEPFMKFSNLAMLESDLSKRTPLGVFAASSIAGKPMILSEFNFPWPNEFRGEGLLTVTAYACLQDWDGVLLFSYGLGEHVIHTFRSQADPVRWGEFAAAALMFHRRDVSPARNELHVVHTPEEVAEMHPDERYAPFSPFRYLVYLSKVRRVFVNQAYRGSADTVLAWGNSADVTVESPTKVIRMKEKPWERWSYSQFITRAKKLGLPGYSNLGLVDEKHFVSDTGELTLDSERGVLLINTDRSKAAIGFLGNLESIDLDEVRIDSEQDFAAIVVSSLDNVPIGQAQRLLITAVSRAENTAQAVWPAPPNPRSWSPSMTWQLTSPGREPVLCEPVAATIKVKVPAEAQVFCLDPTGKRARKLPVAQNGQFAVFSLREARSIWCEVVCTKKANKAD